MFLIKFFNNSLNDLYFILIEKFKIKKEELFLLSILFEFQMF
jgi:hypothetical protein